MTTEMNLAAVQTVELNYPVAHEGQMLGAVTLRRPTVRDSLEAQRLGALNPAELELHMMAQLSGLPLQTLERLDMQDYIRLQAVLQAMVRPPQ